MYKTYGWIPVNIKTSNLHTSDNVGNFAICVRVYTDTDIGLFCEKLNKKEYNTDNSDYYFLVVNKRDTSDIIINSLRGISILTPNVNNLPFQIRWLKKKVQKTP